MKKSKFSERQIIAILKEHERGRSVADICRDHRISQPTFYQWRSKYFGMDVTQLKRVKELETMVANYKKVVAEQMLDIQALKDLILRNGLEPTEKRRAVAYFTREYSISVRRACKLLGTYPSLILYRPKSKSEVASEQAARAHR